MSASIESLTKKNEELTRKLETANERISKLRENNKILEDKNKALREELKIQKAKIKLFEANNKKITKDNRVITSKKGKWKAFQEQYPLLAKSFYDCAKKYDWIVYNHIQLAGYLRKMVEGDPKEGYPAQITADRLARRYAFLASIPDDWWNGKIIFGPPPKNKEKGLQRINDINNLMSNPTVRSFWAKFSKEWNKKNKIESS